MPQAFIRPVLQLFKKKYFVKHFNTFLSKLAFKSIFCHLIYFTIFSIWHHWWYSWYPIFICSICLIPKLVTFMRCNAVSEHYTALQSLNEATLNNIYCLIDNILIVIHVHYTYYMPGIHNTQYLVYTIHNIYVRYQWNTCVSRIPAVNIFHMLSVIVNEWPWPRD